MASGIQNKTVNQDQNYHSMKPYNQWKLSPFFLSEKNLVKVPLNVIIVKQDLLHRKQFSTFFWSEVWKEWF